MVHSFVKKLFICSVKNRDVKTAGEFFVPETNYLMKELEVGNEA